MIKAIWPEVSKTGLLILESRDAILSLAPRLQELAAHCGQPGAMHWLPYFLDEALLQRRSPLLVLFLGPAALAGRALLPGDLQAAAFFSEYRFLGFRTGAVATEDAVGFRTVIAPEGDRARVATQAARALLDRGAAVVLATFESHGEPEPWTFMAGWSGMLWADRKRLVGRTLQLGTTFDETLALMGKSTRFNLRYYRRRLQKKLDCEFLADAAPYLREEDLDALNAGSLNPMSPAQFRRRVHSASTLPGSYLVGLRVRGGPWLSLVGGWRQGDTSILHWQMNAAGWEKDSLGTVMRSFLLEYEISLGTRKLLIFGGTAHTMRHSFDSVAVADLILRRRGPRALLMQAVARLFASAWSVTGRTNFLAETLHSPDLRWEACSAPAAGKTERLPEPAELRKAQ